LTMNNQLSSGLTVVHKFVLPISWMSVSGVATAAALLAGNSGMTLLGVVMTAIGILLFVFRGLPLKRVVAVDDGLIIDNFSQKVKVPYSDIEEVSDYKWRSPRETTIFLKRPCRFGTRIVFLASMDDLHWPWKDHPTTEFLRSKIQS